MNMGSDVPIMSQWGESKKLQKNVAFESSFKVEFQEEQYE